jgi:hypothetical protein
MPSRHRSGTHTARLRVCCSPDQPSIHWTNPRPSYGFDSNVGTMLGTKTPCPGFSHQQHQCVGIVVAPISLFGAHPRTVCRPGARCNQSAGATGSRVLDIEPEARGAVPGVGAIPNARANIDHTGPYPAAPVPTRATSAKNPGCTVNRPALFSGASQDSPDGAVRCLGSARGQNPPAGPGGGVPT